MLPLLRKLGNGSGGRSAKQLRKALRQIGVSRKDLAAGARRLHTVRSSPTLSRMWSQWTAPQGERKLGGWSAGRISSSFNSFGSQSRSVSMFGSRAPMGEEPLLNAHDPAAVAEYCRAMNRASPEVTVQRLEAEHTWAWNTEVAQAYTEALRLSGMLGKVDRQNLDAWIQQRLSGSQQHTAYAQPLQQPHAFYPQQPVAPGFNASPGAVTVRTSDEAPLVTRQYSNSPMMDKIRSGVSVLGTVIWIGVCLLLLKYLMDMQDDMGKGGLLGKLDTTFEAGQSDKRFSDIKGCDEAIEQVRQVVDFLKDPEKYGRLGADLPKGVLLHGPPGTGKTLLAKAVAGEAEVPFFFASGSQFDEVFAGLGARRVRQLFEIARKSSPCVLFIDEIDALAGKRHSMFDSGGRAQTLNQLLAEMDGFDELDNVVVIAATNRLDAMDSAVLRPGRFDKKIAIDLPDRQGRKEILDLYLAKCIHDDTIDTEQMAKGLPGLSGAQLKAIINTGAQRAAFTNADALSWKHLDWARDEVIMGLERRTVRTHEDLKRTAYHEGGHALLGMLLKNTDPLYKVTILWRGQALGVTHYFPESETSNNRAQMRDRIIMAMGGRAAEALLEGDEFVTSGAVGDFKTASETARRMVCFFGMSDEVGPIFLSDEELKHLSGPKKAAIDREVDRILQEAYKQAYEMLKEHRDKLDLLANALLEHETLTGEEAQQVIDGKRLDKVVLDNSSSKPGENTPVKPSVDLTGVEV